MSRKAAKTAATLLPESEAMAPSVQTTGDIPVDVPIVGPDGKWATVPEYNLPKVTQLGYHIPTPEETSARNDQKTYGEGLVPELEAGALGLLRGGSFGLSDVAMRALSPDLADKAAKLKKYNPDASLAGEIASFLVPAAAGIAAGKTAAKGAGLLQGLVSSGGEGLGKIATKIVGDNLAGHALGSGVNLAAQSAVYQAAHNLSEDALGDKDYSAESILANTGQAAVLGAGLGAAFPVAARVGQAVANSAPVRTVLSGAAKTFDKFFDPERNRQLFSGAMGKETLLRDSLEGKKFTAAVKLAGERGLYGKGEVALDPLTRKFEQIAEGGLPNGQEAYERLTTGQKSIVNATEDALAAADAKIAVNPKMRAALTQFPEKAEAAIRAKIDDFAANRLSVDRDALLATLDKAKAMYESKAGSLKGLNDLKRGLYEGIDYRVAGKEQVQITKEIARTVKTAIEAGAEMASPGAGAAVKDLNGLWGALETIRKPLDVMIKKGEANVNVMGLRFRDIGVGAMGASVLGPAGAALGVANKMLQTDRGLLMRAQFGEKLRNLAWAQKLADKTQSEIAGGIKSFLGGASASKVAAATSDKLGSPVAYALTSTKTPSARVESQQNWYDDTRKQILEVASNPGAFAEKQGKEAQGFADSAPGVADALINKQIQIYGYLAQVMPKNPGMPTNVFHDTWKPADYEVQAFRKVVQVARAPLTVLQDLKAGTLTAQQVDAVKTLYPKLYDKILDQVRQQVTAPDATTTYSQRLRLGQLFAGTEPTMDPTFVAAMQTPAVKPDEPGTGGKARAPGGSVKLSNNYKTSTERAANR